MPLDHAENKIINAYDALLSKNNTSQAKLGAIKANASSSEDAGDQMGDRIP